MRLQHDTRSGTDGVQMHEFRVSALVKDSIHQLLNRAGEHVGHGKSTNVIWRINVVVRRESQHLGCCKHANVKMKIRRAKQSERYGPVAAIAVSSDISRRVALEK